MLATQEIEEIVQQTISDLLEQQICKAADLAMGWNNYFSSSANHTNELMRAGKLKNNTSSQQLALITRARVLAGVILVHQLYAVGKTVAAQIEREFPNDAGKQYAEKLRQVDPREDWVR